MVAQPEKENLILNEKDITITRCTYLILLSSSPKTAAIQRAIAGSLYPTSWHYEQKVYAVTSSTEFRVDLFFYIANSKQSLNDLAKPVLNMMFEPRGTNENATALVGVLFEGINEEKISHITLRKRVVESYREQGVDVTVVWE